MGSSLVFITIVAHFSTSKVISFKLAHLYTFFNNFSNFLNFFALGAMRTTSSAKSPSQRFFLPIYKTKKKKIIINNQVKIKLWNQRRQSRKYRNYYTFKDSCSSSSSMNMITKNLYRINNNNNLFKPISTTTTIKENFNIKLVQTPPYFFQNYT